MTAPIKTCDYCGATGEMPTFMNGETICYTCMHVLPKTLPEARQELMRLRAVLAVVAQPTPSVPDGWKEAAIAWEVCASIHREYGKGKDPFFNTRQGDFVKHANDARAMLVAAPKQEAQRAPSIPEGFSREDLEAVADGLDGYEKTVNVGNVTGGGDDHLESTTAYAARFIRAMLAKAPETKP